jgi:hypothetical protein
MSLLDDAAIEKLREIVRRGPCTASSDSGYTCDDCGAITRPLTRVDGIVLPVDPWDKHGAYSRCRWRAMVEALGMEDEANAILGYKEPES